MGKFRDVEAEKPGQHIGCGNNHFGCGKSMRIVKYHNQVEMVEAEGYNPSVHLCMGCANKAAYDWRCEFKDLPFLMTAIQYCKAGRCGEPPLMADVWAAMEKMGARKSVRHIGVQSFTEYKKAEDTEEETNTAREMVKEAIKIYRD